MAGKSVTLVVLLSVLAAATSAAPDARALITEASKTARFATDPETRALCLAEIAVAWHELGDVAQATAAAEEAVTCAHAATTQMAQALAQRTVALRLQRIDPTRAAKLMEDAARDARDLKYAAERAVALREIAVAAHKLGSDKAGALTQAALETARKVESAVFRSACLRDLAAALCAADPTLAEATFAESREALKEAPLDDAGVPLARAELAGAWAASNVPAAQAVADGIVDEAVRGSALRAMAASLASADPEMALVFSQSLPVGKLRARVLAAAAAALPVGSELAAAALARAAVRELGEGGGEAGDETRADAAAAIARTEAAEAVALTATISDKDLRNQALCAVAERVGESDVQAGLTLLGEVDDPIAAEPGTVALAVQMAARRPEEALALVRKVISRRLRVQGLLGIAGALPKG